jgi:hypothetical protein
MSDVEYEVRVLGRVDDDDLADVGAVALPTDTDGGFVYGVPDQSALYGLLRRLRERDLTVVEVRRPGSSPPPPGMLPEG